MSFNEASKDIYWVSLFSLQLFVAKLAVSFYPTLLRSFASYVRREV